ncbi:MAG TPA: PIN domain-containing protein [Candidatus Binatia bacterium]|nr:PIN domain-containing protein [Candidatus Binatia bacterium]
MSAKFFLDTNLFVYSLGGTPAAKARRAAELVREAISSRNGIISYQVVQEFFSVAFRRFTPPMTLAEAESYLASVFRPLLAVHSSQALLADALRLCERYRLSWYDSLIVAAALEAQCGVLYSEDMRHGQRFGDLRIDNPFR